MDIVGHSVTVLLAIWIYNGGGWPLPNQYKKETIMNTKRIAGLLAVMVLAMLAMVAVPALAQNDDMEILREKVRADKKLLVAQSMQLTEEEGKVFWPIYDAYQAEKSKLADRRIKVIEDYAANFQTLSDDVAKDLVDRSIGIQKDAVKLMESYLPKFSKAVGDKKAARFYQIENKIDAIVNFELAANIPLAQ
jgi:hypothetical protein